MTDAAIPFGKRYRVAEMNCGALFSIGYFRAAIPPGARSLALTETGIEEGSGDDRSIMVYRRGGHGEEVANDREITCLIVGDRAHVIGHPCFEPLPNLEPTKTDWEPG